MSLFSIGNDPTDSDAGYGTDVTTLMVAGELDYGAAPHLRSRIRSATEMGRRHLVLDLSAVTFIDSSAIGVLIGAANRLQESVGGSLAIVCVEANERVLRIFDIVGVASLIALYHTQDDARAALDPTRAMQVRGSAAHATAGASASRPVVPAQAAEDASRRYAESAATISGPGAAVQSGSQHTLDQLA